MLLLARQRPRFGSGRIYRLLTQRGWAVNENVSIDFGGEDLCKSEIVMVVEVLEILRTSCTSFLETFDEFC